MSKESNAFDELDIQNFGMPEQETIAHQKLDYLVHKVFKQDADGAELLKVWKKALIMQPTAQAGMDSVGIGINEGMKTFIRNILLTIERVEND